MLPSAAIKIDKINLKIRNFELQRLLPNMEITYIYGNMLRLRFRTAVTPLHSQSTEMVRIFHKWKSCHKMKSWLIRLTINTNLFISKNHYFTLFSQRMLFFSLLQTRILNLKWLTTLQQPWKNWLAPTMWTLLNAKTDLDEFLGQKILSTTWTWNSKCSRGTITNNFDWHKTWQWERQILFSSFDWEIS